MPRRRWLGLVVAICLIGCTGAGEDAADSSASTTATSAFCEEALALLSAPNNTSGDHGSLLTQMQSLEAYAEKLAEEDQARILAVIGPVIDTLDDARLGRADNGWSTMEVAEVVADLCGGEPIGWIVQP